MQAEQAVPQENHTNGDDTAIEDRLVALSTKRRIPDSLRRFLIRVQGGKPYLQVMHRIVWFRDECPDWGVETFLLEGGHAAGYATVQAKVYDPSGKLISSGIKTEEKKDFPAGWVEKAETGAVGRALALAGFGSQFARELDGDGADGHGGVNRPCDSPAEVRPRQQAQTRPASRPQAQQQAPGGRQAPAQPAQAPQQGTGGHLPAGSVWEGPGQCPRCHAPEGKRHLRPCVE